MSLKKAQGLTSLTTRRCRRRARATYGLGLYGRMCLCRIHSSSQPAMLTATATCTQQVTVKRHGTHSAWALSIGRQVCFCDARMALQRLDD